MAKHLNLILKKYSDVISGKLPASKVGSLSLGDQPGVDYAPKSQDERDFVASHSVEMHPDRNGNGDDVFKASNMKMTDAGRHGHIPSPKDEKVYKQANEEVEFSEKKDEREYGYEGEMAISQIKSIMNHADMLMKMLKPDTDMPEWVQSKITLANDYIQTAADYFATEVSEETLEEGGSQYRSAAGSGKNTNPNLSKLARKLAMEKPRSFRPPGEPAKAEKRAAADKLVDRFLKKGGKIRKEETELDEAKCNMTEAGTMCEVHGKKSCSNEETHSASDKEPRYNGKDKEGKRKLLTDKNLQEKAESVAQQKLMALALQFKRGELKNASPEVKKLASSMTEKQLRDFAATKHEGLPKKVQKESAPAVTPITFPVTNSREGFKL